MAGSLPEKAFRMLKTFRRWARDALPVQAKPPRNSVPGNVQAHAHSEGAPSECRLFDGKRRCDRGCDLLGKDLISSA